MASNDAYIHIPLSLLLRSNWFFKRIFETQKTYKTCYQKQQKEPMANSPQSLLPTVFYSLKKISAASIFSVKNAS